jgi:hypothetical protein
MAGWTPIMPDRKDGIAMEGQELMLDQGQMMAAMIPALVFGVFMLICMWKIFTKAGQPGWACLIPIYNAYVMLKIAGKPGWWLILMIIPFVNFIVAILAMVGLAKNFGKGGGFAVGLIFLGIIFFPILAFGKAQYVGAKA